MYIYMYICIITDIYICVYICRLSYIILPEHVSFLDVLRADFGLCCMRHLVYVMCRLQSVMCAVFSRFDVQCVNCATFREPSRRGALEWPCRAPNTAPGVGPSRGQTRAQGMGPTRTQGNSTTRAQGKGTNGTRECPTRA